MIVGLKDVQTGETWKTQQINFMEGPEDARCFKWHYFYYLIFTTPG